MSSVMGNHDDDIPGAGCMYAVNCWLRSANRGNSNNEWNVNSAGYLNNNNANNNLRGLPDCVCLFPALRFAHSANLRGCMTQGTCTLPQGEQLKADAVWLRPSTAVDGLIYEH